MAAVVPCISVVERGVEMKNVLVVVCDMCMVRAHRVPF